MPAAGSLAVSLPQRLCAAGLRGVLQGVPGEERPVRAFRGVHVWVAGAAGLGHKGGVTGRGLPPAPLRYVATAGVHRQWPGY